MWDLPQRLFEAPVEEGEKETNPGGETVKFKPCGICGNAGFYRAREDGNWYPCDCVWALWKYSLQVMAMPKKWLDAEAKGFKDGLL